MGRKARLWEDTVVIALRDMQWLARAKALKKEAGSDGVINVEKMELKKLIPPGFVKLDGVSESSLADVVFKADDVRYFLIEVKPEAARVRDEWAKKKKAKNEKVDGDKKDVEGNGAKKIYLRLVPLTENMDFSEMGLIPRELELSLAGHFFVYFDAHTDEEGVHGAIILDSYIAACNRAQRATEEGSSWMMKKLPGEFLFDNGSNKVFRKIRAGGLFSSGVKVVLSVNGKNVWSDNIGLSKEDFQTYVRYLCNSAGDDDNSPPIHALMLSSDGNFFKVVTSVNQLVSVLEGLSHVEIPGAK